MKRSLRGLLIFTTVEIIALTLWLKTFPDHPLISAVILVVGLFIEHYISLNVGAGRRILGPLPPDKE